MDISHREITQKLMDTFFQLKRSHRQLKPDLGIKHSEVMVLFRIKEHSSRNKEGAKISDLSHCLRVTSPTVTQLINHLEDSGLVTRSIDREDRRSIRVTLTEKGEKVIAKASEKLFSLYSGLVEHLGREKSLLLIELLSESIDFFNGILKAREGE